MTLKELLIKHEGKRHKPYLCSKGKWTIGIGHNIDAKGLPHDMQSYLMQHGKITDLMIDVLYQKDVDDAIVDCLKLYKNFKSFTRNRKMALIDFLFNVGFSTARKFIKANKAINEDRWEDAGYEMKDSLWYNQTGDRSDEVIEMLVNG